MMTDLDKEVKYLILSGAYDDRNNGAFLHIADYFRHQQKLKAKEFGPCWLDFVNEEAA